MTPAVECPVGEAFPLGKGCRMLRSFPGGVPREAPPLGERKGLHLARVSIRFLSDQDAGTTLIIKIEIFLKWCGY
jgi:hypothetical protein